MKKILTIALILAGSYCKAQTGLLNVVTTYPTIIDTGSSTTYNKPDTIECYFQEIKTKGVHIGVKTNIGYVVVKSYGLIGVYEQDVIHHMAPIYFLYADKKRVRNKVIAYIEK